MIFKVNARVKYILFFFIIVIPFLVKSQSVTVAPWSMDESIRNMQLKGLLSSDYTLQIRPFHFSKKFTSDSLYNLISSSSDKPIHDLSFTFLKNAGKITLFPLTTFSKYTSHHPYGWNDGALIPAKGLQSLFSTGFFTEIGPLSIQLLPEYLNSVNPHYEITKSFGSTPTGVYKKFYWGQSSIRLNGGHVSLGVSSENLWWGPGKYSSLMMSNNAPGFLHFSFNSRRPLRTQVGSFEWQLIGGRLNDETNIDMPVETNNLRSYRNIFGSNSIYYGDWKYINAMVFTYQPIFLKGVSIGFSRQFSGLSKSVLSDLKNPGIFNKYLPVFGKLFKSKLESDDSRQWNQLANIFFKTVFQKSHAEFYIDYGWNDHSYNIRDFLMNPTHSSSFIAGAQKSIELKKSVWFNISAEITHMEQTPDYLVRWAGSWYEHYQGTGYSNANQILGVGAGFGSNSQVLSGCLEKGYKKVGVLLERVQREPNTHKARWDDLSYGFIGQHRFKNILIGYRASIINSRNYGWKQNVNRFNFFGSLSLNYRWNN